MPLHAASACRAPRLSPASTGTSTSQTTPRAERLCRRPSGRVTRWDLPCPATKPSGRALGTLLAVGSRTPLCCWQHLTRAARPLARPQVGALPAHAAAPSLPARSGAAAWLLASGALVGLGRCAVSICPAARLRAHAVPRPTTAQRATAQRSDGDASECHCRRPLRRQPLRRQPLLRQPLRAANRCAANCCAATCLAPAIAAAAAAAAAACHIEILAPPDHDSCCRCLCCH